MPPAWDSRFPYIVGQYGGAAFVVIYIMFLLIMGLPIMSMEFSVGRASRKSITMSFQELEPKGSKWHWYGWFGMAGNYLLMMFYTTIAGWLILYFFKVAAGQFEGMTTAARPLPPCRPRMWGFSCCSWPWW